MTFSLLEWRREVHRIYADVRTGSESDPSGTLRRFRAARDDLFRTHPDSPIPAPERAAFKGLPSWKHDAAMRFIVPVEPMEPVEASAVSISGDAFALKRIGRVRLSVGDLEIYWIDVYGGGIFLPFRDGTSGCETYGAGRYLLDTVKGADLGGDERALVIDFNYAYHPSCAYDPSWSCPLAPRANWLETPIRAGERLG